LYAIDKERVKPEEKFELDENAKLVVIPDKTKKTQLASEHVIDVDP
jgi:hypothetical protein